MVTFYQDHLIQHDSLKKKNTWLPWWGRGGEGGGGGGGAYFPYISE